MSTKSFRIALLIVAGSLVVLLCVGLFMVNRALGYPDEQRAGQGALVKVEIKRGMSFPQIARLLHEKNVIERPVWFRLYAMYRGVTTEVKTGEYAMRDNLSPAQVLDTILQGVKDVSVSVTIPEGYNMLEAIDVVVKRGVVSNRDSLIAMARDPTFLQRMGIAGDSVEGYLFPETYRFKVPSKPEEVLRRMIEQHRVVWDRVLRQHEKEVSKLRDKLDWSDRDILIMSSIVEKEAVVDTERPRIAQVFLNRLTVPTFKPKRLETDPTIRYGCMVPARKSAGCAKWDPTQRLRRAQLDDTDNQYNTYQHEGLPPGPICSPGEKSLIATVDPDGSDYFYFVAKDDRSHVFAKTVAEHERNVTRYQR
ncbi:MAG TPA: endolytic transglycosylase MltG [Kofleriaceae bacterium]|nr:endolytic transglycosylase MltG [Kofleriaceae bacterium]